MENLLHERTHEQRREALKKANQARAERANILAKLHSGDVSLHELLQEASEGNTIIGGLRVRAVLLAFPGVGGVTADKTLKELKISPRRRLRGVGLRQRERLLNWASVRTGEPPADEK